MIMWFCTFGYYYYLLMYIYTKEVIYKFYKEPLRLSVLCHCLPLWVSGRFLIWRFNVMWWTWFDLYSWRFNRMCADGDLAFSFLCFDRVWVTLLWPSPLAGRYKPIIYLSACLNVCLSVCLSARPPICLSVSQRRLSVGGMYFLFLLLFFKLSVI